MIIIRTTLQPQNKTNRQNISISAISENNQEFYHVCSINFCTCMFSLQILLVLHENAKIYFRIVSPFYPYSIRLYLCIHT